MDFGYAVFERGALNLIFEPAIPQSAFKSDELPLLGHARERRQASPLRFYLRPLKDRRAPWAESWCAEYLFALRVGICVRVVPLVNKNVDRVIEDVRFGRPEVLLLSDYNSAT
jgi:hypothetical protein